MKNAPGKKPAFQFYVMDWLSDIRLQKSAHSTQGLWIKLICYMWLEQAFEIGLDRVHFHRIGATDDEIDQFVADAAEHKFCDISFADRAGADCKLEHAHTFHILSRRFQREHEQRAKWRNYKRKPSAKKEPSNDIPPDFQKNSRPFPPVSSSSSSSSNSNYKETGRPPPAPTDPTKIGAAIKTVVDDKTNRHFENHVGEFITSIKQSCTQIQAKNGHKFNPYQWVQVKVNETAHPEAIAEALNALVKRWDSAGNPWGYVDKIYKTLKQKFSEADAIAYHEAMKQQQAEISKILGVNLFKEV